MLAFALFGGASWIVLTYLPLLIYEHYHVSLELAAFQATFYMQVAGIVAEPILGHVSDRWSAYNVKNRFYFCALTGLAGLPALMAIGLGRHRGVLIAGLAVFGMVCAAYDVSFMPMLTYVTSKYQRATAYGYLNLASCLSGGAAAMVAALMMKTLGLSFVVASSGGLFLLVFLVLIVTARVTLPRDILMQSVGKGNHVSNN
jgi:predicted MFS family arabinose efflux permease